MSAPQPSGSWQPGVPGPPDMEELLDKVRQEKRQDRLHTLEDYEWARRELRARDRPPVVLVPAAEVWDHPDMAWLVDRMIPRPASARSSARPAPGSRSSRCT